MGRPRWPNCILPAGCIGRIRENQAAYDKDPEGYERKERAREEERQQEEQREREEYQNRYGEEM